MVVHFIWSGSIKVASREGKIVKMLKFETSVKILGTKKYGKYQEEQKKKGKINISLQRLANLTFDVICNIGTGANWELIKATSLGQATKT